MGRRVILAMVVAVLSGGIGGGVAIASTQGGAHHLKVPVRPAADAPHHCHTMPTAAPAV